MIVCSTCGKENQDHYKFCLGCGSDLPRPGGDAKPLATATPPAGVAAVGGPAPAPAPAPVLDLTPAPAAPAPEPAPAPAYQEAPAPAPAYESAPAPEPQPTSEASANQCGNCGAMIMPGFAFCGACGAPAPGAQPVSRPIGGFAKDSARLVLIQPDGTEGGTVEVPTSEVAVGRDAGGFFSTDAYLSPRHAVLKASAKTVVVRDEGSVNGVLVKVKPNEPKEIKSGDIFRMGQELILFEALDRGRAATDGTEKMGSPIEGLWGRLSLIVGRGRIGNAFPIGGEGVILGRERGNILFPEDGYVSGVHARVNMDGKQFFLTDLGSSNGTFHKITGPTTVQSGDFLLMGAQLFRIDV